MSRRLEFPGQAGRAEGGERARPLADVRADDRVWQVLAVRCDPALADQLASAGLEPGARLRVLHHEGNGAAAVQVRFRTLILGRAGLSGVEVTPLPVRRLPPAPPIPFPSPE